MYPEGVAPMKKLWNGAVVDMELRTPIFAAPLEGSSGAPQKHHQIDCNFNSRFGALVNRRVATSIRHDGRKGAVQPIVDRRVL